MLAACNGTSVQIVFDESIYEDLTEKELSQFINSEEFMESAIIEKKEVIKSVKYSDLIMTLKLDEVPSVLSRFSLPKIGNVSLSDNIKCLTLPDRFMEIGDNVFYGYEDLACVNLPSEMTKIGRSVFIISIHIYSVFITKI